VPSLKEATAHPQLRDIDTGCRSKVACRPILGLSGPRADVRAWLAQFAGSEAEFALEGTTGWRFVVDEIERAGHTAHLADPAETAAKRGRKRRAKTDNADCDLQLRVLLAGALPESWIPPAHILELRIARGCGCARC
jgi:transposase